ncbi:DUF397 domain-containing protein [Streptomyces sp. NPDC088261]|uniref:DUF397 domain-containing protein n=1 Tax=Streptomyces sp. NPDC088261 TaxID=3365851 RepID=UPI00380AA4DE
MSTIPELIHTVWVKSSFSGTGGNNCLEWAPGHTTSTDLVPVRDSKNPTGPALLLTPTAWSTFVAFAARQAN